MRRKAKPLHRPDEPIPAEILARMTKPKLVRRFQLAVELQRDMKVPGGVVRRGAVIPVGPVLEEREIIEDACAVVNKAIAAGREKYWSKPQVIEHLQGA